MHFNNADKLEFCSLEPYLEVEKTPYITGFCGSLVSSRNISSKNTKENSSNKYIYFLNFRNSLQRMNIRLHRESFSTMFQHLSGLCAYNPVAFT